MSAGFQREQRYQVFKAKDLEKLPPGTILALAHAVEDVLDELRELGIPRREYVVVESDWPEYELVWQMIEARMDPERKSLTPAEAVAHWRVRYMEQKAAAEEWWKQVLIQTNRVGEARALAKERSLRIDHLTVALMEYQQAPAAIEDAQDRDVEHLRSEITRLQNQLERERSAFIAANLVRDPTNRMVNAEEWTPLDRAQAVITFAKACGFANADVVAGILMSLRADCPRWNCPSRTATRVSPKSARSESISTTSRPGCVTAPRPVTWCATSQLRLPTSRSSPMREHGTLFKGEMVRSILRGTKTMTRRLVKPQPDDVSVCGKPVRFVTQKFLEDGQVVERDRDAEGNRYVKILTCPYGRSGDRLWVKETFCCVHGFGGSERTAQDALVFRADDGEDAREITNMRGWTPSLLMPRIYSRILLEIEQVRLERLQDISDADAIHEGAMDWWDEIRAPGAPPGLTPREAFRLLWTNINGIDSWKANPWVWVVAFRPVDRLHGEPRMHAMEKCYTGDSSANSGPRTATLLNPVNREFPRESR